MEHIRLSKKIRYAIATVLFFIVLPCSTLLSGEKRSLVFLPFKAYRPHARLLSQMVCPPYNTLNPQDARDLVFNNPYSFLHISRPEVDLSRSTMPYAQSAGIVGARNIQRFIDNNWLIQDSKPAFYLYGQQHGEQLHVGIIGIISVDAYGKGIIKKHENTIADKEKAITTFTELERAHVDPVVLTYKANKELDQLIQKTIQQNPDQALITDDNITHKIWVVKQTTQTKKITEYASNLSSLYIADGHHRSAAAHHIATKSKNPEHKFYLAALYPDDHIKLIDYNRIIKNLNGLSKESFLTKLSEHFAVQKTTTCSEAKPQQEHSFGMYLCGDWYQLTAKAKTLERFHNDIVSELDISLLENTIIKPILNIHSLTEYNNIECVGGHLGLDGLQQKCEKKQWQLGFALHPVCMQQFMNVVDAGLLMPAKTTWFEPKLRQGFLMYKLDS